MSAAATRTASATPCRACQRSAVRRSGSTWSATVVPVGGVRARKISHVGIEPNDPLVCRERAVTQTGGCDWSSSGIGSALE